MQLKLSTYQGNSLPSPANPQIYIFLEPLSKLFRLQTTEMIFLLQQLHKFSWNALERRYEAVNRIKNHYSEIIDALDNLIVLLSNTSFSDNYVVQLNALQIFLNKCTGFLETKVS